MNVKIRQIIGSIHMFNSDKPISNENEDELNRMPFVKRLSKSICNYGSQDCLVIGLMGEWGCGKTSILNLTFSEIKKEKDDWIFIDFNPWYFSNQDNLILQFFNRLLNELKFSDNLTKKAKETLFKFMKGISISANLKFLSANLDLDKVLKQEEFEKFNSFKQDLIDIFYNLDYKIIISIDNIDRLSDDEIQQIFLLVKSLADFPNVIYILSFDQNIVIKTLNKLQVYSGEDYIKKIIQIEILVPEITQSRKNSLIFKRIYPIYEKFSKDSWIPLDDFNDIYWMIVPFIKNIRDLNRLVNIFNFYLFSFKDEININDFLLLLVLQLFEKECYDEIKNNKKFLLDYVSIQRYSRDEQNEMINDFYNNLCNVSKADNKSLLSLLVYILPIFNRIQIPNISLDHGSEDDKELRLCSNNHFDKYFTLSLEDDDVSNGLINQIVNLDDFNEISIEIKSLNEDGKSLSLFTKLIHQSKNFDKNQSVNLIRAIFVIADEIVIDNGTIFSDTYIYIEKLLDNLFNNLNSSDLSFNLICEAISKNFSLYSISRLVYGIECDWGLYGNKQKKEHELYISKNNVLKLEKLIYEKIKELANNKQLFDCNHLLDIIQYWEIWGNEEEINDFLDLNSISSENLAKVLISSIKSSKSIKILNGSSKTQWTFDFEKLKKYYDFEKLINVIDEFKIKTSDETTLNIFNLFLMELNQYLGN